MSRILETRLADIAKRKIEGDPLDDENGQDVGATSCLRLGSPKRWAMDGLTLQRLC